MTVPEHWFGPPLVLADDERWIAHLPAHRTQGKRAVAGGLHVTTQRLIFTPRSLDAEVPARRWTCGLAEVASVGVTPRRSSLFDVFSDGRRRRLRVDLRDGRCELFVVANPEERAAALNECVNAQSAVALPVARVIPPKK